MKKQKIDLTPANNPQGVPSDADPTKVIATADGSYVVPREYLEEEPSQAITDMIENMSSEEVYTGILKRGIPRQPKIEARIDMSQIDPELLQ